jgi:hypothetical protein
MRVIVYSTSVRIAGDLRARRATMKARPLRLKLAAIARGKMEAPSSDHIFAHYIVNLINLG